MLSVFNLSLSILVEFSFEEKLNSKFYYIFNSSKLFLTGLFDYSNEQLEENFLKDHQRGIFQLSQEIYGKFIRSIESKFVNSSKIQNEIKRIRKILPYSSFFRSEKSKKIMEQVEKINNEENLLSILKKYVK